MTSNLIALGAARKRQLAIRGLAAAMIARLQICDGYEFAGLLGQSPTTCNRQAVLLWADDWVIEGGNAVTDLDAACREFTTCIEVGYP